MVSTLGIHDSARVGPQVVARPPQERPQVLLEEDLRSIQTEAQQADAELGVRDQGQPVVIDHQRGLVR